MGTAPQAEPLSTINNTAADLRTDGGGRVTRESIKAYFERVAPEWNSWHEKNGYYHRKMSQLVQGMVPPGETILELGSGTGDNLEALKPLRGVGLNLAQGLTALARQ